ncbi:MAG: 4-(cytidine 5'-diphospho)-2-C-methyl-D-erythritol kinase, partial [Chlorobi bacterium]|nr:4-(cytidine 5'-diphospho)-2-C-methyl-D-erythritol kinase [Chlorobiota bacterium]
MLSFPNAKINLGLSITGKRLDGFHNIETIMVPIGLCDVLEIIEAKAFHFSFATSGLEIKGDENQNLVVKAWNLLQVRFDLPPVKIHLHKAIPMGAGLGGGSSDAAFLIKNINTLFGLKLSVEQMEAFALELGSDCPFFIRDKPVLATGRGELFEDIELDLGLYHIIIVKPEIHMETSAAYGQVTPVQKSISLKEIMKIPISRWKGLLINDFEKPVFEKHPAIRSIKDPLYEMGAVYVSMSGSGSAVFGLFREIPKTDSMFPDCFIWSGE